MTAQIPSIREPYFNNTVFGSSAKTFLSNILNSSAIPYLHY